MPGVHGQGKQMTSWNTQYDDVDFNEWLEYEYNYRKLLTLMHPHPGTQLLDIGCGNGDVLALADEFKLSATGIENQPEAAAISQKNAPEAKVVVGSAQEIPFEDNQFDLVTCFGVMEFFSNPGGGMWEIFRVLKPGGRACIVLPNADFVGIRSNANRLDYEEYEVFYPLATWKSMLAATGFTLVNMKFIGRREIISNNKMTWLQIIREWFMKLLIKFFPKSYAAQFICICQKNR